MAKSVMLVVRLSSLVLIIWSWEAAAQVASFNGVADSSKSAIRRAERLLLEGDRGTARELANNVWLSSSGPELREAAWRILLLTEPHLVEASSGHDVSFKSVGGRDHDRFRAWLVKEFVAPNDWVLDVGVAYELRRDRSGRFDEIVRIRFALESEQVEAALMNLLVSNRSTYSTSDWHRILEQPIHPN
jgi:hypothetical protein